MDSKILYVIGGAIILYAGYTLYINNHSDNVQAATEPPKPLSGQGAITPPKSISTILTDQVNTTATSINSSIQGFFNNNL